MPERFHAGYLRRSAATSENPGNDSREAQELAVRRLAGDEVVIYADWGISGGGDGTRRPEYQRLKGDVADGRVASVNAYSLTRLGRNARELMALVELCKAHDVALRTASESIDTSTAMGRAMLGMMAVMAELELEQGKERSAAARAVRVARHRNAGLLVDGRLPSSVPAYGTKHVTENGLTRVLPDEAVDLQLIVDAYVTAGSVKACARLLNERSVPSPRGRRWSVTPTRRLLERLNDAGLVTLPPRHGRMRHPVGRKALFAGLLQCHCGRRLTPNVARGQYYCASSVPNHGRMAVTEKALVPILRAEANLYTRAVREVDRARASDVAAMEGNIERRQAALDARLDVDRITPEDYRQRSRALAAERAELFANARVDRVLLITPVPEWPEPGEDPTAINRHLLRIWRTVQMDDQMVPTVVWRDSRYRFDPANLPAVWASPDGVLDMDETEADDLLPRLLDGRLAVAQL